MSGSIIIGIDHGYAAMKTVHFSFPTGLVEYEHEPYTQKDVLEYGDRYYVVGSGRQPSRETRHKQRTTICLPWQLSPKSWSTGVRNTPPASTWRRACP